MIEDLYGIVTDRRARRAQWGNRTAHGKVCATIWRPVVVQPGPLKPPPAPKEIAVTPQPLLPPPPSTPVAPIHATLSVAHVLNAVTAATGISVDELRGQSQRHAVSRPRQFAYWLLKERMGLSLTRIGKIMGGKDHTSARTGWMKTRARLQIGDPDFVRWRDECAATLARFERAEAGLKGER